MLDYESIKSMAKRIGRPVKELLALAQVNDSFYAGVGHRGQAAEWFATIWSQHGTAGAHLRRIHYRLVSPPEGVRILLPDGREYRNTERDWKYLCCASLSARYLGLVPFDCLIDQRNDEPMIFAAAAGEPGAVQTTVVSGVDLDVPDMPTLPYYSTPDISAVQACIVEVWVEKSTQNDWLVPLCRRRGVNVVVGIGEQSETRSRELAHRAANHGVPVRVLYLSDFDPAGRSMPKAVARKVEFTIQKFGLEVDLQLIPVALTPEQCREYSLPRTPIKDTERRKDRFEQTFGIGATELDALEALHPGELGRLLEDEIDNYLDRTLAQRVGAVASAIRLRLQKIESEVEAKHEDEIARLTEELEAITERLEQWQNTAEWLWQKIEEDLQEQLPDLSDVAVPISRAPGKTERFVLYDSSRDYFSQLDRYHAWREGDE